MNKKSIIGLLSITMALASCIQKQKSTAESMEDGAQDSSMVKTETLESKEVPGGTPDLGPNFNPVAAEVAYYSYTKTEPLQAKIFVSNLDGSNQREISTIDSIGFHTEPKWSPNGKQIAYTNFLEEGARIMSVSADGKNLKELAIVSKDGYHMFSSWDLSSEGYYFFHWPKEGFTPDAYYAKGERVERLTDNGRTNRPQMTKSGVLYVNYIDDLENYAATKQLFDMTTKDTQDVPELEGEFITGNHSVKTIENENSTTFVLEDLQGNDLRELGQVPYKGIMFTTVDESQKYVVYNTSFEDGAEIHLLEVSNGQLTKLTEN